MKYQEPEVEREVLAYIKKQKPDGTSYCYYDVVYMTIYKWIINCEDDEKVTVLDWKYCDEMFEGEIMNDEQKYIYERYRNLALRSREWLEENAPSYVREYLDIQKERFDDVCEQLDRRNKND